MRIIAGELGGRRLRAPRGAATRPTSDRVREALFSILGAPDPDTHVLDLFAGAGALGLEALSRGAASCLFVDHATGAVRTLRSNIAELAVGPASQVQCDDARRALDRLPAQPRFRWVFLDPPYADDRLLAEVLDRLGDGRHLAPHAVVVVEHDRRRPPAPAYGCLVRTDSRRYGDTQISFYRQSEP